MKIDKVFLQQFCGEVNQFLSADVSQPFSDEHFTYATDGTVIIRVPRLAQVNAPWPLPVDISKVVFLPTVPGRFITLPKWVEPEKETCLACKGTGKMQRCQECEGDGYVNLNSGYHEYEVECRTCQGSGQVEGAELVCAGCGGAGETYKERYPVVNIEGYLFTPKVLRKLELLEDLEIFLPDCRDTLLVHQLRWSGGAGVAMGCDRG